MDDIVIQIEKIEVWFVNADYRQCYEAFHKLCESHHEFKDSALLILSDFNDLCRNIEKGVAALSEQHIHKREIAGRFQMCMNRFKECHLNHCTNSCVYTQEADSLKQHRNRIRKTKLKIEDEYTECDDPKKISVLKKILQEIRSILERFENLLKYFSEVTQL